MYLLYDEVSPFTLNRSVMVEYEEHIGDHMMLCMDTGYVTYRNLWNVDSPIHEVMKNSMPENVWNTSMVFGDRVWYKMCFSDSVIHFQPEVDGNEEYWCVYSLKNGVETDSNIKCVLNILLNDDLNNPDTVYLYRVIDYDTVIRFSILNFGEAFDAALGLRVTETDKLNDYIDNLKQSHKIGDSNG